MKLLFLSGTVIFELQNLVSVLFTYVLKGDSVTMLRNKDTWARGGSQLVIKILTLQKWHIFSGKSLELKSHQI